MMVLAHAARSAKGRLEPFEYNPGQLGPHQVDVRVTHCGICHTDAAMVDNDWGFTQYLLVPGHEVAGPIRQGWTDCSRSASDLWLAGPPRLEPGACGL
jgi:alcohol/geraniol dehydrogenase (NADP+)